ncbi:MAG: protein-disulfide isomerase [Zetaproteobacteria bacterium CG06_land_8_20_14_3_00_59_53]|nr:MAG: hypothetical protein AUK36_09830 [Zetaproteobacteria bacterium CG2_30_59_37]PIO90775.1 MAG: protein-disulfide isomerase [Zetaproteobacteria bacterium CG23_combo_of_CG06-09_8_20_14_all_59_86]PIQ65346.1 MAG: protein-disulfide isomerase [Zetaproteobacteria bacterium CG11_big_fil_rev_8_21_14_0_20_59_439]PIU69889.1 MAG: protein-disulfide isomerase [Zetaproteobacteria bacterium CG06_land_8_20_14_3_00_59_53]PIU97415.1 MAG: protein-disulfide isomerase [Zetaproteobacteria bacterium CG03_land_8_2
MDNDQVKATIAKNLQRLSPQLVVRDVRPLDAFPGLYEVRIGDNIFYTDASGDHMISGHIFDTAARSDITQARIEDLNRVDWKTLPLKNAIVSGDPKGKPVAVFTDPDCPFCRHLEKEMPNVKGVKVYTFLMPLESIHKHARGKAEAIWCARDKHKALQSVMLDDKQAADLKSRDCKTPIDENIALAESLGINGTPTLIAGDGRKHAGSFTAEQLEAWVSQ